MTVVKKGAKRAHGNGLGNFKYHGYTYNNNVITPPLCGVLIQLKGGYK